MNKNCFSPVIASPHLKNGSRCRGFVNLLYCLVGYLSNFVGTVTGTRLQNDLQHWLSASDPWTKHNIVRETHYNGTLTWFTRGKTFNDWKWTSTGSVLWIHGIRVSWTFLSLAAADRLWCHSGLRKDCLLVWATAAIPHLNVLMLFTSSTIIQDIWSMWSMRQTESAIVAFFYFSHQNTTKLDARSFLSSLLVQLCNQSDRFCEVLSTLYMAHDHGSRQPGEDELMRCLWDMISQAKSPVYIIVDALDECPESSGLASPCAEVLEIIRGLIVIYPRVHLCIASRFEMDIRRVLEPLTHYTVSLDKDDGQREDITEYIKFVVHSDSRMREWPEEDKKLVVETLTQDCGGMYAIIFMIFRSTF